METIQDNYDFFRMHEDEQDKWLEQRPVCVCCGIIFRMIIVMTLAEKSTVKIVWFHASGRWCDVLQTLPLLWANLDPGESCDCLEKKKENNKNILAAYRSGRDGQMEMKLEELLNAGH